jgi:hypothetical protein
MNALVFTQYHPWRGGGGSRAVGRHPLVSAQSLGAVFGLAGGGLAGLTGSLFTAAGWFVAEPAARHALSAIGTTLLFFTIPLLIFGACCLDWVEKDRPGRGPEVPHPEEEIAAGKAERRPGL